MWIKFLKRKNLAKNFWELNKLFATSSLLKFCFCTLKLSSQIILLFQWWNPSESLDQMILSLWFPFYWPSWLKLFLKFVTKHNWSLIYNLFKSLFPNLLFNNTSPFFLINKPNSLAKNYNNDLAKSVNGHSNGKWILTQIYAEQLFFKFKYLGYHFDS